MALPGTVQSDAQAFQQIESRFQDEVGRILARIDHVRGPVPFWALMRMMFPVVESLGDLIYRKDDATAENLRSVLQKEFESVRSGYSGKAATLAILYRHSLTHHDELRVIKCNGRVVTWAVSSGKNANHLKVTSHSPESFQIEFQPRSFYEDIVKVCQEAQKQTWNGEVKKRYNGWLTLDLDAAKSNRSVTAARNEIAAL